MCVCDSSLADSPNFIDQETGSFQLNKISNRSPRLMSRADG